MPRWVQILLQSLAVAGGAAFTYTTTHDINATIGVIVTGATQLGIGAKAQSSNPDGTPATQPYVPAK